MSKGELHPDETGLLLAGGRLTRSAGLLSDEAMLHFAGTGDDLHVPWALLLGALDAEDCDDDETNLLPEFNIDDRDALIGILADYSMPKKTPLTLHLDAKGVAGRDGFRMTAEWRDRNRRVPPTAMKSTGGFLQRQSGELRRMSRGQFDVAAGARQFSGSLDTGKDERRKGQLLAKAHLDTHGVSLSPFLSNESVVIGNAVKPRLELVEGGFRMVPHIDGVPDDQMQEYCAETSASNLGRPMTVVDPDFHHTRVVFDDRAVSGMESCRQEDVITPHRAAQILSNPQELDDGSFDLSEFSDRVLGVGPIIRRPTPRFEQLETGDRWGWNGEIDFAPLSDADDPLGETNDGEKWGIDLHDEASREWLKEEVAKADQGGVGYIPSQDGKSLIEVNDELRKAIQHHDTPEEPEKAPAKVDIGVLVKENTEELKFGEEALEGPEGPSIYRRPPNLKAEVQLYPYQKQGVAWLCSLSDATSPGSGQGALLADDMGLGKTLQALSLLDHMLQNGTAKPHLVVAPVSLLSNWRSEAKSFFGARFSPVFSTASRSLAKEGEYALDDLASSRLVLTSYETLCRYELIFSKIKWGCAILDEAQKAKNPNTQVARVVRALNADFRLAMTGTPVETTLKELWTIYDWALPGLLGTLRSFGSGYLRPLRAASTEERRELADRLHERVKPYFFRRMKAKVLGDELKGKRLIGHNVPMAPEQRERYSALLAHAGEHPAKRGSVLHRLFGVCCHPDYVDADSELRGLDEYRFPKADKLLELLDRIRDRGEKVLIFARWRKIQRWLRNELLQHYNVSIPAPINGEITGSEARAKLIDEFSAQDGFAILVLAPRAAGCGLNITAANHVIHYTREWNPAVENQATDRAYRIGQKKEVYVHTITCDCDDGESVEQVLDGILTERRELMEQFVIPMGGVEAKEEELSRGIGLAGASAKAV